MEVNFFWKGNNFLFIHYITILSHIKVGHRVIIWQSGDVNNHYYNKLKDKVIFKNADEVFCVDQFIKNGGNFRTASALWRFNFLYNNGGLYCDTDAYALRHFPNDEWIIASGEDNTHTISNGIIKAPPKHPLFLECIRNIKYDWGNVGVFTEAYINHFDNIPHTYDRLLYPYTWREFDMLFKEVALNPACYSVHLYGKLFEDNQIYVDEEYNKPSLLYNLIQNVKNV